MQKAGGVAPNFIVAVGGDGGGGVEVYNAAGVEGDILSLAALQRAAVVVENAGGSHADRASVRVCYLARTLAVVEVQRALHLELSGEGVAVEAQVHGVPRRNGEGVAVQGHGHGEEIVPAVFDLGVFREDGVVFILLAIVHMELVELKGVLALAVHHIPQPLAVLGGDEVGGLVRVSGGGDGPGRGLGDAAIICHAELSLQGRAHGERAVVHPNIICCPLNDGGAREGGRGVFAYVDTMGIAGDGAARHGEGAFAVSDAEALACDRAAGDSGRSIVVNAVVLACDGPAGDVDGAFVGNAASCARDGAAVHIDRGVAARAVDAKVSTGKGAAVYVHLAAAVVGAAGGLVAHDTGRAGGGAGHGPAVHVDGAVVLIYDDIAFGSHGSTE